jgi:hypothetical protein
MSGFDKEKFYKETSEGFKKKKLDEVNELFGDDSSKKAEDLKKEQERERTLSEKYAGYDDASDAKKQRIENRDKRRQERYAESKKRTDAKRERYAEKMAMKGIVGSKQEARARFDNIRGITKGSAIIREGLTNMQSGNTPDAFKQYLSNKAPEIEDDTSDIASANTVASVGTGKNTTDGSFPI